MYDNLQIAAVILLVALLFLTRNDVKRRFYLMMPLLLGMAIVSGFAGGWRNVDFWRLGLILIPGSLGWFFLSRMPAKK